jgi:hypothetical protein
MEFPMSEQNQNDKTGNKSQPNKDNIKISSNQSSDNASQSNTGKVDTIPCCV